MRRRHKLGPDNFPFLAVLLCAMGSLIVVLFELDRRARKQATARAESAWKQAEADRAELDARMRARRRSEREAEREAELDRLRATAEARAAERVAAHRQAVEELRGQEKAALDEQARVQVRLDELLRALQADAARQSATLREQQEQAARLEKTGKELTARKEQARQADARLQASRSERERLSRDLILLEEALANLKQRHERERKTLSIVPYVGRRGLNRKPLYVECDAQGLLFHPDRHRINERSILAGDVLAEVKRRAKDHSEKQPAGEPKEPYWMLLVRPDGIGAYYAFLNAVKASDVAYGYEFVDAGWALDFPDPSAAPPPTEAATPLPIPVRRGGGGSSAPPGGGGGHAGGSGVTKGGPGGSTGPPALGPLFPATGSASAPPPSGGPTPAAPASGAGGGGNQPTAAKTPDLGRNPPPSAAGPAPPAAKGTPGGDPGTPSESSPPRAADAGRPGEASSSPQSEGGPESGGPGKGPPAVGPSEPPPLRPASRNGNPEWVLVVDCTPEGVKMTPSQTRVPLDELTRDRGPDGRFARAASDLVARRLALRRPQDPPVRVVVRFVVHRDGLRAFHLAYPLLDGLDVEKRAVLAEE